MTNYWHHIFSFCAPPYWLSALLSRVGGGLSRTRTKEVLMGLVSAVSGVVTTPPTEPPPATEPRLKPLRLRRRLPPGTESPGPRPAGPSTRRSAPPSTRSSARPLTTRSVPWPTGSRWRPQSLVSSVDPRLVFQCQTVADTKCSVSYTPNCQQVAEQKCATGKRKSGSSVALNLFISLLSDRHRARARLLRVLRGEVLHRAGEGLHHRERPDLQHRQWQVRRIDLCGSILFQNNGKDSKPDLV